MKKYSLLVLLYLIILTLITSCGGGGGGGGAVSFSGSNELHNGGESGGWGNGHQTGGGFGGNSSFSSGSNELLFESFPSFFYPIDHIDISLNINGTPAEFTGLDTSAKKDVLGLKNGDKVSGTLVITLADGSTRNATLSPTTIGIETKLSFSVTYKYILKDSANSENIQEGTYTAVSGINLSGITWPSSGGANAVPIVCWKSSSNVIYAPGITVTGITGDIMLTAFYTELYTYTLIDSANAANTITDTYTASEGINLSGISWTNSYGHSVSKWKSSTGTIYQAGTTITGITGNVTLTAYYLLNFGKSGTTLFRYGPTPAVTNLPDVVYFNLTGGVPPFTATATINGVATSAVTLTQTSSSGYTSVAVAVNNSYGINAGETIADTATANGAEIKIRIEDNSGDVIDDSVRLVDCIENTSTGIKLNTNNTLVVNNATSFTIPNTGIVNGDDIGYAIPTDAFRDNNSITSLTLPDVITNINAGAYNASNPADSTGAFSGSSIQTLTASHLGVIGAAAFANSQITTITDWSTVSIIGIGAFANCTQLDNIDLSNITSLFHHAFCGCSSLANITWWGSNGPSAIPESAFDGTALTSASFASFPSIVTTIGSKAFANTGITDLSWLCNTNVNTIASDAFDGCTLSTALTVPDSITDITYAMPKFKELGITEVTFNGSSIAGADAFEDFTALEKITVTGTSMQTYDIFSSSTFTNCTSLRTIDCSACTNVQIIYGCFTGAGTGFSTNGVIKLGASLGNLELGACQNFTGLHFEYEGNSSAFINGTISTTEYSSNNTGIKVHCLGDDTWLVWSSSTCTWTVTTAP